MRAAWTRRHRTERTADPARRALAWRQGLAALTLAFVVGCFPPSTKGGVPGEHDVALFDADTQLVFAERLTVGSRVDVTVTPRRGDDEDRVLAGTLASSDESVLRVVSSAVGEEGEGESAYSRHEAVVELTGPGEAHLELRAADGSVLDRILLKAARPRSVELLDGTLLGSAVDARVPHSFALVDRREVIFTVGATDRCGGAMLDFGGVELTTLVPGDDEEPERSPYVHNVVASSGVWSLTGALPVDDPLVPRRVTLRLSGASLAEPIDYALTVVPPSAVDEVDVAVATAEPGVATVWGRAFVDDEEVIGLSFEWESNARVTLNVSEGPVAIASISFPAEGEPADARPALVTAEVFGTEGSLDLLTLRDESQLKTGRLPPVDAPAPTGPSCGGTSETCDPYQLGFFITALLLGRRLTRKRA